MKELLQANVRQNMSVQRTEPQAKLTKPVDHESDLIIFWNAQTNTKRKFQFHSSQIKMEKQPLPSV